MPKHSFKVLEIAPDTGVVYLDNRYPVGQTNDLVALTDVVFWLNNHLDDLLNKIGVHDGKAEVCPGSTDESGEVPGINGGPGIPGI